MGEILNVKNITKRFPGVLALDDVSMDFNQGEVHALVGMNGSGKSTLMKIITGVLQQDAGDIYFENEKTIINNVHQARELGISIIYQELSLVPSLTVAENISLGQLPSKKIKSIVDWKEIDEKAAELLEKLEVDLDLDDYVEDLPLARQQMVEIAKACSINAKVLIMDEPSAVLTQSELDLLFKQIKVLKDEGVCIIYISHRLEEVFEIADRVSVLKDGKKVGTKNVDDITSQELIKMMVGKSFENLFPEHEKPHKHKKLMEIEGLSKNHLQGVNFDLYDGEIVGIYGLVGSGQQEFVDSIFGIDIERLEFDKFMVNGEAKTINSPKKAIKSGIGLIPEDRKVDGLMLNLSVKENMMVTLLERISKSLGLIDNNKEEDITNNLIDKLNIKTSSADVKINNLSGGNQQKVVISKWTDNNSEILVCDEPTRGIDVDAKAQVYNLLEKIRKSGVGIVIISSELSEIVGMCDRIYVLSKYQFLGPVVREEANEELLLSMASGVEGSEV